MGIIGVGESVADKVAGRTVEELMVAVGSAYGCVTEDSSPYRDKGYVSHARELKFYIEVLTAGLQDHVVMANNGRWKVLGKYWFFSQSGKWQVVGKKTVYLSKNFTDFVERFLTNDYTFKRLLNQEFENPYIFQLRDGALTAQYGRHKGKSFDEVQSEDESYAQWAISNGKVEDK